MSAVLDGASVLLLSGNESRCLQTIKIYLVEDNWLERMTLLVGEENTNKLQNAKVLVVGLGGVGGFAAEFLAGFETCLNVLNLSSLFNSKKTVLKPIIASFISLDSKVIKEEKLIDGLGRVRSVRQGPDGYIYAGVENVGIVKIIPKK